MSRKTYSLHARHRWSLRLQHLEERITPDTTPHNLAVSNFYQNWNDPSLIAANDNWSGVPSVVGFLGDDTFGTGVDPQTVLTPYATIDVIANQGSNTAVTTGGMAEFDGLADPVIALQGSGTADAPNLVVSIKTTGRANISISYTLRDIDGTADDAIQPVALQYRIGNAGNFVNVPAGFVADATTGPNLATKVTPVSVTLPGAVDNQLLVQVRIITTNAVGNDEWVGVDNIVAGAKEFAISTFKSGSGPDFPSVAVDADGDAVVVWESFNQDGSGFGIYGQRFNSAGAKVGGEFLINTYTTNFQRMPSVAVDADGDAVVVWESQQDSSIFNIYGQRFNSAGAKVGGEFLINTYTTSIHGATSVAVDADGDAVVVWVSVGQDGDNNGVYGQRFNSAGAMVGGEFQINTYTTNSQNAPSVALDADGDAFVTWDSDGQDGSGDGIYGQRFNLAGAKVGGEFQINTYTTGTQRRPSVAVDADGDAVIAWRGVGAGSATGIYGQRFNSAGAKVGGEFQINTYTTGTQLHTSVAVDADGDAVVVWTSYGQDGVSSAGAYGQRFNSAGAKVGGEFQINTETTNTQNVPRVAVDADGDAVVAWRDFNQVAIYGQRFGSPNPDVAIEFAINTFTIGQQVTIGGRNAAVDADGDAIVVWGSTGQDGSQDGVYGQRFNSSGLKVGSEFPINTHTTGNQLYSSVAVDADGDAMVVWASYGQDGSGYGIYGQRFNSTGAKVGSEFPINTYTTNQQSHPSVAMDAAGNAVVVWESTGQDGSGYGIYGQRYDAAGAKVGTEFKVNTYTTSQQKLPSVAMDADGDAVVVWESDNQDGSNNGVYGQRFNSAGAQIGAEFQVNTYTTGQQRLPSVAVDADGDAVMVWASSSQDGNAYGVYGQRFNAAGAKVGGEFLINTFTTGQQLYPSVAVDADGDAVVAWHSADQDGSGYGVYGQRFNAAGAKVGGELLVNTYTTSFQSYASVAMDADGDTLVVWRSYVQDGSSYGIYGQRFGPSPAGATKVSTIQINDGSVQRSMVTSVKINFDSIVSFVGDPSAAFALVNQKTSSPAILATAVNVSGTEVTLTFTGGSVDLGGSLSDGRYTLTAFAALINGGNFDGNGDGAPGDNFVLVGNTIDAPKLFRYYGDSDGDGDVDNTDFVRFRGTFNVPNNQPAYLAYFDFDGDGDVDNTDFLRFRSRFNQPLP